MDLEDELGRNNCEIVGLNVGREQALLAKNTSLNQKDEGRDNNSHLFLKVRSRSRD